MTDAAESRRRLGQFHDDAAAYQQPAVIAEALELTAAGQGADRVGLRCIRTLYRDGAPVLDDRGGVRRAILAGVVGRDRIERAAALVAELNSRAADDPRDNLGLAGAVGAWDIYVHAQRVVAPISNRLQPGAIGCVRGEGIGAYTTVVVDIDPEPGAAPGIALDVAGDLVDVLVDTAGVPVGAILIMQSGRGAYVLIGTEPQPLSARETMKMATQTIARIIEAAELPAHGDESVFDAPRIIRAPGTVNHKATADPTTPAWVLQPWTPGVRCAWSVVEKLASKSRPKLRAVPTGLRRPETAPGSRRPLRALFTDRGWLYRERADGVCEVRCPNADQHTDGRDGAILYPPTNPGGPGWLKCSHAHCAGLTLFDVFKLLEGRA